MKPTRLISLPTVGGGLVTIPEPLWCSGHADAVEEHREDIEHQAPEQVVTVTTAHGPLVLLSAVLAQAPFRTNGGPEPFAFVALAGDHYAYDAAGLRLLAAEIAVKAPQMLRTLAAQIAALNEGGERR